MKDLPYLLTRLVGWTFLVAGALVFAYVVVATWQGRPYIASRSGGAAVVFATHPLPFLLAAALYLFATAAFLWIGYALVQPKRSEL